MIKHTPGPWFRYTREGQMGIVAGEIVEKELSTMGGPKTIESYEFDVVGGCGCCDSPYGVDDHDTAEANARLIAAAPDLLDALNGLLTLHENVDFTCDGDWNAARAAIAKATGDRRQRMNYGQAHHRAKLTDAQVAAIRQAHVPGKVGYVRLARQFGVSESTIRDILTYRTRYAAGLARASISGDSNAKDSA